MGTWSLPAALRCACRYHISVLRSLSVYIYMHVRTMLGRSGWLPASSFGRPAVVVKARTALLLVFAAPTAARSGLASDREAMVLCCVVLCCAVQCCAVLCGGGVVGSSRLQVHFTFARLVSVLRASPTCTWTSSTSMMLQQLSIG